MVLFYWLKLEEQYLCCSWCHWLFVHTFILIPGTKYCSNEKLPNKILGRSLSRLQQGICYSYKMVMRLKGNPNDYTMWEGGQKDLHTKYHTNIVILIYKCLIFKYNPKGIPEPMCVCVCVCGIACVFYFTYRCLDQPCLMIYNVRTCCQWELGLHVFPALWNLN